MIVDTHVHLNDPKLYSRLDEIINDAIAEGVGKMIVSGYDYESSLLAIEIANHYPQIYATIGIHPSEVQKFDEDDLNWIRKNITNPKVVGIGEIGLDYYWDTSFKEKQITYFLKQLQLAEELNYPVVIHSRSAALDTYECLKKYKVNGVMHCYAYSLEMARKFIDLGYALGIGGVVTFKNAHLKEIVKEVELEHLVTETDAPYLAPTPYRGKINEPKYTKIIILEIAKIKNLDLGIVEEVIFKNFQRIFNIKEV